MRLGIEICFALALSLMIAERCIVRELGPLDLLAMVMVIVGIVLMFVDGLLLTVFA